MFNRLHPFMDADDGTEINEVEESEEMQEVADPADDEEGEEEQEAADPAEDEQDKSDSAFADMRRRLKEAEEKAAKLEAEREEYDQTLGLFFEGDNHDCSYDSRMYGYISQDKVVAKYIFTIYRRKECNENGYN